MKKRSFAENLKNAAGTIFLFAAAFFVFSTLLSVRAVFADPIAPENQVVASSSQSGRSGAKVISGTNRTSPRASTSRSGGATTNVVQRNVAARASRVPAATTNTVAARTVKSRATTNVVNRGTTGQSRTVRARTGTVNQARVSLTGTAIRGTSTTSTSYLSTKLYTGNYSNIIDSTTGLISADAYSNCLDSYYACMDEICTARNSAQRRCACAGRVKTFAAAEEKLKSANEELIKVSGELALLISTKGKDVSSAFKLTDAEKIMNCVSYQEMDDKYSAETDSDNDDVDDKKEWCYSHMIYDDSCTMPTYCTTTGNDYGFDISDLNGSSSDILASLKSWADAKDATLTITTSDDDSLTSAINNVSSVVSGLNSSLTDTTASATDSLAETWGYELFEYAHNNVCNRVLDSCFNGIYEACGTPPSTGRKCTNGNSTCPYNYNSNITVTNTGTYELNFVTGSTGTSTGSASCYGYSTTTTSTNTDPYSTLRGPVADARRSILQKYALDANADCDAYGEELKTTAQNIGYQKVAAQQALQKKRLEFAQDETATILADAVSAGTNFNECISEIYDCYNTQASSNSTWTTARIKTYCAQVAEVPSCYKDMICNPSGAQFKAIIDELDSATCKWSQDYTINTCRNVVTLNEILTRASDTAATTLPAEAATGNSAAIREMCLQSAIGTGPDTIRTWTRP